MTDLTWVEETMVVREGDPAKDELEESPRWHLLHVTGGMHGPVEYVFGRGTPPKPKEDADV